MQTCEFKVGETAMLKSGGPAMNVIGISPRGRVWCEWPREGGYVDELSFHPATLVRVGVSE